MSRVCPCLAFVLTDGRIFYSFPKKNFVALIMFSDWEHKYSTSKGKVIPLQARCGPEGG